MIADSNGFTLFKPTSLSPSETYKDIPNPGADFVRNIWRSNPESLREMQIEDLVCKAINAYTVDGLIKQTVDRYVEPFKEFDFEGGEKQVKYLKKRLKMIGYQTGEPYSTLFTRLITEYIKCGNSFVLKVRGGGAIAARRPFYANKPYSLSALFLISADRIAPVRDNDGHFIGWHFKDWRSKERVPKTVTPGATRLNKNEAFHELIISKDKPHLAPSVDIVQIAYMKGADSNWGFGQTLAGLEDVALLRSIEQNASIMMKKFCMPLLHHKVDYPGDPLDGSLQVDISYAYSLHNSAGPEGVFVTGPNHEIKSIGAESQALRMESYLNYFLHRACASLGVAPYLLGFGDAQQGTADQAKEFLMTKIRFCIAQISEAIQEFILNELLWEGGFNPMEVDEDIVKLVVKDFDEGRMLKMGAHAADQYSKGVADHSEARKMAGYKGKANEKDLYLNKHLIPLELAKANAKGDNDVRVQKAKPKPKSKEEWSGLSPIFPQAIEDISNFFWLLERQYNFDPLKLMKLSSSIELLLNDEEALLELLYQELSGDDGE